MSFESNSTSVDNSPAKVFTGSTEHTSPDGWIDQNGIFYGCTTEEHDICADFLLNSQKKSIIKTLLYSENSEYSKIGSSLEHQTEEYPARMVLQSAGFALLSSNQLNEVNLPDNLTFSQMEFAKKNNIAFMPLSGQLDYESYREFLESVKDWQDHRQTERSYDWEERKIVDRQMGMFLNDPTKIIYFMENDSVAKAFFNTLTVKSDAEVSVEAGKDKLIWRHLPFASSTNIFLEFDYHYHGYDSYPLSETWVKLVNKQEINKFLDKKNESSAYRYYPRGDVSILK